MSTYSVIGSLWYYTFSCKSCLIPLRCLWDEINLDEEMFPHMVELLHHLGLACQMPSDGSGEPNLLVPWFLIEYPDAVEAFSESLLDDQVQ